MDPDVTQGQGMVIMTIMSCSLLIWSYRIVPNYELAPALEQVEILRVVVRESTTEAVSGDTYLAPSRQDN